jgi:elongation factor Ts
VLDRERAIYRAQAQDAKKPEKVMDRIVEGKVEKFYSEVCLLEQPFIKDQNVTIQDLLNGLIGKLGEKVEIRRFCRFQVGEGIAKN